MLEDFTMNGFIKHLHEMKNVTWLMVLLYFICPFALCFFAEMLQVNEYAFLIDVLKCFCVIMPLMVLYISIHRKLRYMQFKNIIYEVFDVGKFARRFVRSGEGVDLAFC